MKGDNMEKRRDYNIAYRLDVMHKEFEVDIAKAEKNLAIEMVYELLNVYEEHELILYVVKGFYDDVDTKKANELVEMLYTGCDKLRYDIIDSMFRAKNSSVSVNTYKAFKASDAKLMKHLNEIETNASSIDEEEMNINFGITIATYFKNMVDKYDDLSYEDIYILEKGLHGVDKADRMFSLARHSLNTLIGEFIDIKEEHQLTGKVGKIFKEYLASEEYTGAKRKTYGRKRK